MKLKTAMLSAALASLLMLSACGGADSSVSAASAPKSDTAESPAVSEPVQSEPIELPDLTGEWTQEDAAEDMYHFATIQDGVIEIFWRSDADGMDALYWSGTYDAPTAAGDYAWDSVNDTSKTDSALLASGDATKTFSYADGKISYEVTVSGETGMITLVKTSDTVAEPSASAAQEGEGDVGAYHVKINGAAFGEDYDGNPMIVVHYDFTNNSDETASALWSLHTKAFQDGIELETAFAVDSSVYDSSNSNKEVRPGVTIEDCQVAFTMTSDSPVEVEISELISFDNSMVTKTFSVE